MSSATLDIDADLMAVEDTNPFVDLAPYLTEDYTPELPTIGRIEDGGSLLYKGRLNEIHGEPSAGKTNVSLAIACDVLSRGGTVLFIDPEDHPGAIVNRLLAFGADPQAILERFLYLHNPDPTQIKEAISWLRARS